MTSHGALNAIRLPVFGTLGKGQRAAFSASRLSRIPLAVAVPAIASVPAGSPVGPDASSNQPDGRL